MKNYVQFSQRLALQTVDEVDWWRRYLSAGDCWDEEGVPVGREARLMLLITQGEFEWGFQAEIKNDDDTLKPYIWFHAEERGDPDHVVQLVHLFFRDMRPAEDAQFTITWSDTCDKMLVDQFGGGAALVTREEIRRTTTWEWLSAQQFEIAKHHKENNVSCIPTPSAKKGAPPAPSSSNPRPRRKSGSAGT